MDEEDTTTLQPSQTAAPLQIAIELGLTLVPFESEEWFGMGGKGEQVSTRNIYWLKGSQMHSGPFKSTDQALNWLYNWYRDWFLRYQQGEQEESDQ